MVLGRNCRNDLELAKTWKRFHVFATSHQKGISRAAKEVLLL